MLSSLALVSEKLSTPGKKSMDHIQFYVLYVVKSHGGKCCSHWEREKSRVLVTHLATLFTFSLFRASMYPVVLCGSFFTILSYANIAKRWFTWPLRSIHNQWNATGMGDHSACWAFHAGPVSLCCSEVGVGVGVVALHSSQLRVATTAKYVCMKINKYKPKGKLDWWLMKMY